MPDPKPPLVRFACFACTHETMLPRPAAGALAVCPVCGVRQALPAAAAAAVAIPRAPAPRSPRPSPARTAWSRLPARARVALTTSLTTIVLAAVYHAGTLTTPAPRSAVERKVVTATVPTPVPAVAPEPRPPIVVATLTTPAEPDAPTVAPDAGSSSTRPAPIPEPERAKPTPEPNRPDPKPDPKTEPPRVKPKPEPEPAPKSEPAPAPAPATKRAEPRPTAPKERTAPGPAKAKPKAKAEPAKRDEGEARSELADFRPPRTVEEIHAALRAIEREPAPAGEGASREEAAALRRLKGYRYLCGLSYADLAIDAHMTDLAAAAAEVCEKLEQLNHNPTDNPGLPDERFAQAREGASQSNLAVGPKTLVDSVDLWMDDTDGQNTEALGHRRWCLNPSMSHTGLARSGRYSAMYAFDRKGHPDPLLDAAGGPAVCFPPPGFMPVGYFPPRTAWSISLDPADYRPPRPDTDDPSPSIHVYRVDRNRIDREHPVPLDAPHVNTVGCGLPYCLIFQPKRIRVAPGARYWVEVTDLQRRDGSPATLAYLVEFIR
jgi:Cysteine-rich secretory protein family